MSKFSTRHGFQLTGSCFDEQNGNGNHAHALSFKFYSPPQAAGSVRWSSAPFASISSGILKNLGNPAPTGNGRLESNTGYEFPAEFCYLRKHKCPALTGLGVRSKNILIKNVNVYALGIYVDHSAAKHALSSFKNKKAADLEADQKFYDAVLASTAEKTLRLVISTRLVDRKKFLDALDERLAPRLKQEGEPATLDAFRKQFDGIDFEKGMEIAFVCSENKKLVTQVKGAEKGVISSPALCKSLFDIYLGSDPVSKDAKSTFGRNLATVLNE